VSAVPVAYPPSYRQRRSAAELVGARARSVGSPFSAMVEIADRCNEACVHCYQVQGEKGELDTLQWERIFRELAELGVLFLTISGGEATLRKDFLQLVAYARSLRFAVRVFSNGLRLTPEVAAELGRLAVQEVQLSLYAPTAAAHDAVTRVAGSFDRVIAATRDLRAAGVRVVLKTPLMQDNAGDQARYVELATSLGADYMMDPKLVPREDGDLGPTRLAASRAATVAVRRDPRFGAAPRRADRPRPDRSLNAAPCGACRGNLHIEPNGELRPCTLWNVPTGHALVGSLREAWYEDPAASVIRNLTWNDLPGCRTCDLRPYCQRCFAEAESYTGDALAPYAAACSGARWKYEAELGQPPEIDAAVSVSSAPIGPFQHAGGHRFLVSDAAPGEQIPGPSPRRGWLPGAPAAAPPARGGLVQLRRSGRAALTPDATPPSPIRD
jgi:radical SAM protein with 4Fe4S-binding SPASM domain